MGKTSTPMKILVTNSSLADSPELVALLKELKEQGHQVTVDDALSSYHFIAGPNCWYCVPEVAGLFDLALKQGRKIAGLEKKALPKKEKVPKKPAKAKKTSKKKPDGVVITEEVEVL